MVHPAYRSPEHRRDVGGAASSKQMEGGALNFAMANHPPGGIRGSGAGGCVPRFGYYPRSGFIHVDLGHTREWSERFSDEGGALPGGDVAGVRSAAESRTLKGGGAVGPATLGAAGVEVGQEFRAETQAALRPLVPNLDTLRWVLMAVALVGSAVTIYARLDDSKKGPPGPRLHP